MEVKRKQFYHVHRYGNMDNFWKIGNEMTIDSNYDSIFYNNLLQVEKSLVDKYDVYDLDYIINDMEKYISCNQSIVGYKFKETLRRYYFLRRELALEEGRNLFNANSPSRLHSIYLTDKLNLNYWKEWIAGDDLYKVFLVKATGNMFVSSDDYFPNHMRPFNDQIEQSKKYWNPKIKKLTPHKEFLFQGDIKIIK